jgi:DNA-directed RNA polymerase subunit RPC12/RpoP
MYYGKFTKKCVKCGKNFRTLDYLDVKCPKCVYNSISGSG